MANETGTPVGENTRGIVAFVILLILGLLAFSFLSDPTIRKAALEAFNASTFAAGVHR